jgi:hypothetical protein
MLSSIRKSTTVVIQTGHNYSYLFKITTGLYWHIFCFKNYQ